MKVLKQLSATILLALVLSASAYAGDMPGPTAAAPGDMNSPPAPVQIGEPSSTMSPGDMSTPALTVIASLLGFLAGY
jgi:hypothetical protein